jgi:iron complex transport system ATP-binding protein
LTEEIIHIRSLDLAYEGSSELVLSDVNLRLNRGEVLLILGENGSGKSTLIRAISGLLPYQSGSIEVFGKEVKQWSKQDLARKMALVLTEKNISGMLGVEEFVAFGRYPFTNWLGKLTERDQNAVEQSIERCGLQHLRKKRIDQLSDGEKQKVFLARALAQSCDCLILDEPTTHLDVKNTVTQLKLIQSLSKKEGKSIVFSSHQFDLALQVADKVCLIEGQQAHLIKPQDFYDDCRYQEMLLGEAYRFDVGSNRFNLKL